jgi:hypothetical protein
MHCYAPVLNDFGEGPMSIGMMARPPLLVPEAS